ncbi:MAG: PAS domain S-box protein [Candidatus Shapirobacteria bacterium]|jgi:PAS domain S-box-containing protein
MKDKPIHILYIEDSTNDAELVIHALVKAGWEPEFERMQTAEAMRQALEKKSWDVILSDYRLPQFSGLSALAIFKESGLDIPFIIVSGAIGEETAVEAMKAGANDYIMKDHLQRLAPALERELQDSVVRREGRKAHELLKESRRQLAEALEIAHLGHWVYNISLDRFTFNDQFYKLFHTTVEEVGGYTMSSSDYARRFVHPDDLYMVGEETRKAIETDDPNFTRQIDHRILYADGSVGEISVRIFISKDAEGKTVRTFGVNQDITERKNAERTLRESEERYRSLFDYSLDAILLTEPDGAIIDANPSACRMFGRTLDQIKHVGRSGLVDLTDPRISAVLHDREEKGSAEAEITFLRADGGKFSAEVSSNVFVDKNGQKKTSMFIRDTTEKHKAEEKYRTLFREMLEGFALHEILCDAEGTPVNYRFIDVNPAFERVTGLKAEEIIGETAADVLPSLERSWVERYGQVALTGEPAFFEDYSSDIGKWFEVTAFQPEPRQFACIFADITKRKEVEIALRESEGKYRSIVDNAQEGIFQTSKDGRYLTVNQALATMLGYDSPADLVVSVTDIGRQIYYDEEDLKKLLAQIDQQGVTVGFECRYRRKDGAIIWVSLDQHTVRDREGVFLHYEGFCEDITEKHLGVERLRGALGATVNAIAAAVEARDPYTAGHQSRVAALAQAIAVEINLPADQIEGLRLAAMIHDLGKITVPAEILAKPKKLTDIEFSLIKLHSQTGYDILKNIEFPWPIARIVLEHHERMNGSGYPNSLEGDRQLLESRILAVADVVESMASFRPYRPALGIDAALEEIEKNKGILYDGTVADACTRLFREKGYALP